MALDLYTELRSVVEVLNREKIPYAVVGDLACSVYREMGAGEVLELLILPIDWERVRTVLRPREYHESARPLTSEGRRLIKAESGSCAVLDFRFATPSTEREVDDGVFAQLGETPVHVAIPKTVNRLKALHTSPRSSSGSRSDWAEHLDGADDRLRKASALRRAILEMKFSMRDAFRRGETPYEPEIDIRSDPEYWEKRGNEKDPANA